MVKRAKSIILCDTNIFLKAYYKDSNMLTELSLLGYDRLAVSVITKAEVIAYMNKGAKADTLQLLNKFIHVQIDQNISTLFDQMMLGYYDYHPSIPDCMIAASAIERNYSLFTLNRKHFIYYSGLTLYNPVYSHS